jgi:hypothetical protein
VSPLGSDRRIPTWAAGLVGALARELPAVVTRNDLTARLAQAGIDRDPGATVNELRRLGWLVGLPVQGTWAFIPPGQEAVADPYLPLRAWQARDPDADFLLAGSAAAWHLGYLDRRPERRIPLWLPSGRRLPDGLRPYASVVHIRWATNLMDKLRPTSALLVRRQLDIVTWASRLPSFGPEALIVQLAARPASFKPWADLVAHLDHLVTDCDDDRLADLLNAQSASTWQRAAYLLHAGGAPSRGREVLNRRPRRPMPKVRFEHPDVDCGENGAWSPDYYVSDRLIYPLQQVVGKA